MPLAELRGRLLDARPDRLDLRDRRFVPRVASLPERFPQDEWAAQIADYVRAGHVLDQGSQGACTGFGLTAVVDYLYWRATGRTTIVSPRMLYHLAQLYDEWRGEDYTGSSCRGAIKGWHKHGVCLRKFWPYTVDATGDTPSFEAPLPGWDTDAPKHRLGVYYRVDKQSIVDMQAAIAEIGAIYVSADVHDGWDALTATRGPDPRRLRSFEPKRVPVIEPPKGKDVGGHAFAFVGYTPEGFIVQNSWGTRWGYYGFAVLPYTDWLAHGTDAWVCALGVPAAQTEAIERAAHHFVSGQTRRGESAADLAGAPPSLLSKTFDPREYFEPLSVGEAYERTLVLGNDGIPEQRLVAYGSATDSARYVCGERPRQWFAAHQTPTRRLVVYAHGGLNDELDSIERIRVLSPYFEANGCLPLFLSWHTGFLDTVVDLIRERLDAFLGTALPQQGYWDNLRRGLQTAKNALTERTDRAIEVGLRSAGGKAMWSEMKDNAAGGASARGGLCLMADALAGLAAEPAGCEIHLVGHSAGSIVHGHLLRLLAERGVRVASCHLLAPACTVDFAVAHYVAACNAGQLAREHLHLHTLSDARETADTVGGIYRKSLLYLVSRAFEAAHKTPILGLLKCFDPACNTPEHWNEQDMRGPADNPTLTALQTWQRFFWGDGPMPSGFAAHGLSDVPTLHVIDTPDVCAGPRNEAASHGSFDNDVQTMRSVIAAITGTEPQPAPTAWNLVY